jgi:HD-like signal output (HDOD) protein
MPSLIGRLKELLARGDDLPTLPTIVLQLHRVLDDPDAGAAEVAAVIEKDPALTARLLRVANSAAFSRGGRTLGSVAVAVGHLGVNQVRSICMVLAVVKAFGGRPGRIDHQRLWVHAATVAATARRFWEHFDDGSGIKAEDAYVGGLLHDVGFLILDQYFPEDLAEVLHGAEQVPGPSWTIEEEHLGLDHGAIGGLLIGRWSLPTYTAEAVANHHHPEQALPEFMRLAWVIKAAEAAAVEAGAGLAEEGAPEGAAVDLLAALGAPPPEAERLLRDVPDDAQRARDFLS